MKKGKKKFNLENFIKKSKNDKKKYILSESKKIKTVPSNIIEDLKQPYKYKEVINRFIVEYIKKKQEQDQSDNNDKILNQINNFKKNYIENTLPKKMTQDIVNLYSLSGAIGFAKIQLVLRSLSTSMGSLWEKIAICSNTSISTEKEFGLKITGIDLISLIDNNPTYIQMKTMEDTLTGGQSPRSESELSIHKFSFFASAFDTGRTWHFRSTSIKKYKGKEFWSKINLDYDYLLEEVKLMIKEIENKYYELTKPKS